MNEYLDLTEKLYYVLFNGGSNNDCNYYRGLMEEIWETLNEQERKECTLYSDKLYKKYENGSNN